MRREASYSWLDFAACSAGARIVDEAECTHVVADRVLKELDESKEHVQPQWVIDSLNSGRAKPCAPYQPGGAAPPHLSPFVEADEDEDEGSDSEDAGSEAEAPAPAPEKEAKDMAKMLMSKKAKRLYGRMQHGRERKQAAVARLRKRRELLAARARS